MNTSTTVDRLPPEAVLLLETLLDGDEPVHRALRAQIPHLRVIGRCTCPCASLDFGLDRSLVAAVPVSRQPVADATVADAAGKAVGGALVFAYDGYLSHLEVYTWGDDEITVLPSPEQLLHLP